MSVTVPGPAAPATRLPLWWRLMAGFLGIMWAVHALEKSGVIWPDALAGHTQDVIGMLRVMAQQSPFGWVRHVVETAMLPLGNLMRWAVLLLELALAAVMLAAALAPAGGKAARLAGRLVPWAAGLGTLFHGWLWLGFFGMEWPWAYPVVLAAHAAVGVVSWRPGRAAETLGALRLFLGALWLFEAWAGRSLPVLVILAGVTLALGLLTRGAALAALVGVVLAAGARHWGVGLWAYYSVGALLLAVLLGDGGMALGIDRLWRRRDPYSPFGGRFS